MVMIPLVYPFPRRKESGWLLYFPETALFLNWSRTDQFLPLKSTTRLFRKLSKTSLSNAAKLPNKFRLSNDLKKVLCSGPRRISRITHKKSSPTRDVHLKRIQPAFIVPQSRIRKALGVGACPSTLHLTRSTVRSQPSQYTFYEIRSSHKAPQ